MSAIANYVFKEHEDKEANAKQEFSQKLPKREDVTSRTTTRISKHNMICTQDNINEKKVASLYVN